MSKKTGGVIAVVGLCALSLLLLSCGSSSSRPSGLLYVLTEGSSGIGNNVSSFSMDLNSGNLSLVNSNASTCPGQDSASCGPPLNIVLDATGATAFVLNQGIPSVPIAPTIYSYPISSDGSLAAPNLAATLNLGDTAVAMTRDAAGQFLFVINLGFTSSPENCPPPGTPDPGNPVKYAGCPSVSVYSMQSGSTSLTFVSQFAGAQSPLYLGRIPTALSTITYTSPGGSTQELLFVTSNSDPVRHNDNTVGVYAVGSDGTLTEQANSPYATLTNPISVLAINTNPVGQNTGGIFVYIGNQGSVAGAVTAFQLCTVVNAVCTAQDVAINLMVPVGGASPAGQNPVAMVTDPSNNFLYIACQMSSQVFGYRINTTSGALTAQTPPSQPTGSQPVALALHPSVNNTGQFLYTSNSLSSNISGFTLDTTTGTMSIPFTVSAPSTPSGMTAR